MGDKLVNWGMIGTGDVTEKKSGPAFNKVEGSRLVAVANRTPSKAEDYAMRFGIPRWHRDPMDVIRDPEVDAVYVATPPGSHLDYAMESIRSGKPVYIEKPMARTYAECRTINEEAGKAGVPVFVAYYRRSLDYFLKVKELVESGVLGKILQIDMEQRFPAREEDLLREQPPWRIIPGISGGGYFHDMGCHALDMVFYLFGNPLIILGKATNRGGLYDADDTVSAILTLPEGVQLTGSWSFVVPPWQQADRIHVSGEKGKLSFSVFSFEPITLELPGGTESSNTRQPEHIQMPLIRAVVGELLGKDKSPSTGDTAAVTSLVMDRICGGISG